MRRNAKTGRRPIRECGAPLRTPASLKGALAWFDWQRGVNSVGRTWTSVVGSHVLTAAVGTMPTVGSGLEFDGVDDVLEGAASLAASLGGTNPFTVVARINRTAEVDGDAIWGLTDGAAYETSFLSHRMVSPGVGSNDYVYRGTDGSFEGTQGDSGSVATLTLTFSGTAFASKVNGVASIAGAATSNLSTANKVVVGTSDFAGARNNWFAGSIYDLVFYNRVLSAADLAFVSAYLEAKTP